MAVGELLRSAVRATKSCVCVCANGEIEDTEEALQNFERQMAEIAKDLVKKGMRPSDQVKLWMKSLKQARKDSEKPEMEKKNECSGLIPYVWRRYKKSRRQNDWNSRIGELRKTLEGFGGKYEGRPFSKPLLLHFKRKDLFQKEISQIKEWLMEEDVQVIGVRSTDSDSATSLLKMLYNSDEVRYNFDECFLNSKASFHSANDIKAARAKIGKAIGCRGRLSKQDLSAYYEKSNFQLLLVLDGVQDGFGHENLEKIVTEIGLPSLKEKKCKIVFSCGSEQVVADMRAEETSIIISPEEFLSKAYIWPKKSPSATAHRRLMQYHALKLQFYFAYIILFFALICSLLFVIWRESTIKRIQVPNRRFYLLRATMFEIVICPTAFLSRIAFSL